MKILKQSERYKVIDVRNTHESGSYQLLEKFEVTKGETTIASVWTTCGIYFNKKDALKIFNQLN